jgi:hypothetical protein
MHNFTPLPALAGGLLIGLASALLLLSHGKIAGISGILGGLIHKNTADRATPFAFVLGLLLAGVVAFRLNPGAIQGSGTPAWVLIVAGLLVGYGTRLGNGCTSGHGVCGVSRLSPRSIAATAAFMAAGMLTVFVVRRLLGGW